MEVRPLSKCHSCKLRYVCEEFAEWECTHNGYRGYMPEDSVKYSSNAVEKVIEAWNRRAGDMAEYIERGAALREAKYAAVRGLDPVAFVEDVPVADVAPVVHGRWIRPHWKNSNYCCDCSECGGEAMHRDYQWDKNGIYPICPNCGAKMDGGAENG